MRHSPVSLAVLVVLVGGSFALPLACGGSSSAPAPYTPIAVGPSGGDVWAPKAASVEGSKPPPAPSVSESVAPAAAPSAAPSASASTSASAKKPAAMVKPPAAPKPAGSTSAKPAPAPAPATTTSAKPK